MDFSPHRETDLYKSFIYNKFGMIVNEQVTSCISITSANYVEEISTCASNADTGEGQNLEKHADVILECFLTVGYLIWFTITMFANNMSERCLVLNKVSTSLI